MPSQQQIIDFARDEQQQRQATALLEQGAIKELIDKPHMLKSIVRDDGEEYAVRITKSKQLRITCNCPQDHPGCSHSVATLLLAQKHSYIKHQDQLPTFIEIQTTSEKAPLDIQFNIARYRNSISISLTKNNSTLTTKNLELESFGPARKPVELLMAAVEREVGKDAPLRIDGLQSFLDYELLNHIRLLSRTHPESVTARIIPHAVHASLSYSANTDQPFVLVAKLSEKHIPIDGKQASLFGHERLWAVTEDEGLTLFELDSAHPDSLEHLAEKEGIHLPTSYLQDFIQRNFSHAGRTGRTFTPGNENITDIQLHPTPRLYLSEDESTLLLTPRFAYKDYEVHPTSSHDVITLHDNILTRIKRDLNKEQQLHSTLLAAGLQKHQGALTPSRDSLLWLAEEAQKLVDQGWELYGKDSLLHNNISEEEPELRLATRVSMDWIELDTYAAIGDEEIPFAALLQMLHNKKRYIKLADGKTGIIPEHWLTQLAETITQFEYSEETGLRAQKSQLPLVEQALSAANHVQKDERYEALRQSLLDFEKIPEYDLPEGIEGVPRDYQKAGYNWMRFLAEHNFGGLLADEMGLGKTLQALCILLQSKESLIEFPNLVIAPTSLLYNWDKERAKFTPSLSAYIHHGSNRIQTTQQLDELDADIIITTYNTVLNDADLFAKKQFNYVMLDEAQYVKNPDSKTSKFIRTLKAKHRVAITGTPIENSSLELWSHFAFLNPGLLGNMASFNQNYARHLDEVYKQDKADQLRKVTKPFIMQRKKEVVAKDLPEKQIIIRYYDMERGQQELYDAIKNAYRGRITQRLREEGAGGGRTTVFEGLLRLRQIANHPKLLKSDYGGGSGKFNALCEHLRTVVQEGHKALVFSSFLDMLTMTQQYLNQSGIKSLYLDGSTKDRMGLVDEFQEDEETKVFLISLKAGGVGLTLTAADYVFILDPWWNPAAENQAIDRAHRIGQKRNVFVYKTITRGSVEEKILELQQQKMLLLENVINVEEGITKHLTSDDINYLFE